eukprot:CAMPEP_0113713744 /NCGR_PEP_ID=MMETSP0038_2-20120614/32186_1 /TAXON_ID=2898 /ORGANISM="Cryptomonas paramecium" /LENGTH=71 /DNA_ID=CAMNT_0000640553 /DNA_START=63 /DNA_END=278 /DNA_ORIENTATION=- /assembly_acc=CAM_ASM_000170
MRAATALPASAMAPATFPSTSRSHSSVMVVLPMRGLGSCAQTSSSCFTTAFWIWGSSSTSLSTNSAALRHT